LKTKTKPKLAKPQRRPEELTVTLSRTVQVRQYEPVTVTVTERHVLGEDEATAETRLQVYNQVASDLARFMDKELKRYQEEEE
jgi:hypothetical protein